MGGGTEEPRKEEWGVRLWWIYRWIAVKVPGYMDPVLKKVKITDRQGSNLHPCFVFTISLRDRHGSSGFTTKPHRQEKK